MSELLGKKSPLPYRQTNSCADTGPPNDLVELRVNMMAGACPLSEPALDAYYKFAHDFDFARTSY